MYNGKLTIHLINIKKSELFTVRELDVFNFITLGLTAKQIAKRLDISYRTVEDYIERIKTKLGCTHRSQIIEKAIHSGIVKSLISK